MSERLRRVEEVLRRELSGVIIEGELRDPRLSPAAAIGVTGVKVSPDLSSAQVFIDVLSSELSIERVLQGLNAARSAARARLTKRIRMKRVPALSFHRDESIGHGANIERVLKELAEERAAVAAEAGEPSGTESAAAESSGAASPDADAAKTEQSGSGSEA